MARGGVLESAGRAGRFDELSASVSSAGLTRAPPPLSRRLRTVPLSVAGTGVELRTTGLGAGACKAGATSVETAFDAALLAMALKN